MAHLGCGSMARLQMKVSKLPIGVTAPHHFTTFRTRSPPHQFSKVIFMFGVWPLVGVVFAQRKPRNDGCLGMARGGVVGLVLFAKISQGPTIGVPHCLGYFAKHAILGFLTWARVGRFELQRQPSMTHWRSSKVYQRNVFKGVKQRMRVL